MTGGKKFYSKLQRWADEFKLAIFGVFLATKKKSFVFPFLAAFFFFGALLNLLVAGDAGFKILLKVGLLDKLAIIFKSFLGTFGLNRGISDFLFIFFTTLFQSTLIGLTVLVYKHRKNAAHIQNAGIVSGLIVLGSGCPTCGTTVLAPIIVGIAGSSGMAIAGTVSWVLTILSLIFMLYLLKKVGLEAYTILAAKKKGKK